MSYTLITTEEILDDLEIKIGDTIELDGRSYKLIINDDCKIMFKDADGNTLLVKDIIDREVKIIRPLRKLGETLCKNISCSRCPLKVLKNLCSQRDANLNLYKMLDMVLHREYGYSKDGAIYRGFKAALDMEVKD